MENFARKRATLVPVERNQEAIAEDMNKIDHEANGLEIEESERIFF
jgi:hypothetical protein